MNPYNDLNNRIAETKEFLEICKANHKSLNLPSYISNLELSSLERRLADLENQQNEYIENNRLEEK